MVMRRTFVCVGRRAARTAQRPAAATMAIAAARIVTRARARPERLVVGEPRTPTLYPTARAYRSHRANLTDFWLLSLPALTTIAAAPQFIDHSEEHTMRLARPLTASLLIVGLSTSAFAGDLKDSIDRVLGGPLVSTETVSNLVDQLGPVHVHPPQFASRTALDLTLDARANSAPAQRFWASFLLCRGVFWCRGGC